MIDTTFKIDIKNFIGPLDKKEEPRSLKEIHAEVGFPFSARAVAPSPAPRMGIEPLPVGSEIHVIEEYTNSDGFHGFLDKRLEKIIEPNVKRWILLGHK